MMAPEHMDSKLLNINVTDFFILLKRETMGLCALTRLN